MRFWHFRRQEIQVVLGYFWRKDGSVAKLSVGKNCILLSESQGLAY